MELGHEHAAADNRPGRDRCRLWQRREDRGWGSHTMDNWPSEDRNLSLSLEPIAMVALDLGAERVDLRAGYASLAVTIGIGDSDITRMRKVGELGVNQRLDQELWHLAKRVSRAELTLEQARVRLARLPAETPRHSPLS